MGKVKNDNTIPAGYKRTEVGVIPEDWEVKEFGDIGQSIIGLTYSPTDVSVRGILVHRSSNVQNNRLAYGDNVFVKKKVNQKLILQKGDILICVRNGSRHLIGKSAIISGRSIGHTFGAFMSIFRTDVNQNLIFQIILSDVVQKQINQSLGATINQITNKTLNGFKIPFPKSEPEQTAIATVLSEVDAIIEKTENLITKKRAIKQGAMQELLTGKRRLPGFGEGKGTKRTEVGVIPEDWEVKELGECAEVVGGGTPSSSIVKYWGGKLNWFTPTEVGKNKYVSVSNRKITKQGLNNSSAKILPIGTILLTSRAGIGDVALITQDAATNQGFQSLVVYEDHSNEFLYYLVKGNKNKLLEKASGSTFLEISPNSVRSITLAFPSKPEQTAIATVLSDMDTEIETLEEKLNKYKQLKTGMMQQLLTGKIRLLTPQNV